MNGKSGSNHQDEDNDSDDHKGDNTSTSGHDARHFRLLDAILACADDEEKPATDDDSKLQQQKRSRIKGDMCYLVGLMRLKGVGLDKDLSLAVMYFEKASKLGHDGASYQLAMMMEDQYTYPDLYDIDQSVALYEKMITSKRKKKTAGTSKSSSSSSLSTTASTSTAVASVGNGGILTLSGPDASALIKLARVYYEGNHQGESRNLDKAYQYARKVAESTGEKYCQFMVGDILLQRKDIQQSLFWLTQSGQQGFPLAIEALARVYFEGIPPLVKQDYELAHEWCLKGDDIWPSGLGYCQSCLGDMYRQGLGVPKDQMKSFEYYQKAASQQDAPQNYARYMLGEL
jgi:TPR repeat protein